MVAVLWLVKMSRVYMLYEDEALKALPVKLTNWKEKWDEEHVFQKESGPGLIIEGIIRAKSK